MGLPSSKPGLAGARQSASRLPLPHARLAEAVKFRGSSAWQRERRRVRQANPLCQQCGLRLSEQVHHVHELQHAFAQRLDPRNLLAVCAECHEKIHQRR